MTPTDMPTIYLAGKVGGIKHLAVEGIESSNFVYSDSSDHSEHGWGFAYGLWNLGDPSIKDTVAERATAPLASCDGVLAVLDVPDSYGSVAEIAYAASFGKAIKVVVINVPCDGRPGYCSGTCAACAADQALYDAYWFVCGFPGVESIVVDSLDKAKAECRKFADAIGLPFLCESPIEAKLAKALARTPLGHEIRPQHSVGEYRIDLALPSIKLAIECDGHEFHASREQRTSDAARARLLQQLGWEVVRVTGTEIHRNIESVIKSVLAVIQARQKEFCR